MCSPHLLQWSLKPLSPQNASDEDGDAAAVDDYDDGDGVKM